MANPVPLPYHSAHRHDWEGLFPHVSCRFNCGRRERAVSQEHFIDPSRVATASGRYLQVIFVIEDGTYYVIHARGLTDREKRQLRRRRR